MANAETLTHPQSVSASIPPDALSANPWRQVLEQAGAEFDGDGAIHFGQPPKERADALAGDVVTDLSQLGLIKAHGEDAQKFLAGLFTGDIRLVSPERGLFTAWCDAKGRAQATFWVLRHEEAFYVLLPLEMVEAVLAGLKRYMLRVKVSLADASDDLARIGLSGAGVAALLESRFGVAPPSEPGVAASLGDCTVMAVAGGPFPRWLVLGSPEKAAAFWQLLVPAVKPLGRDAWSLLDILAGIPLVVAATAGEFIPQMLNMESLGGLCFTKGCYPGQEVIARLHYRGQLKRKTYLAFIEGSALPAPGTRLHRDGAAESVGEVVSAARHPDGRVALLAVVKIEEKEQGTIHLEDATGPELAFVEQNTSNDGET